MNLRSVRLRSAALWLGLALISPVGPLGAEQTADGADVAALLKKARAGDVAAQLKLATHVLDAIDAPPSDDAVERVPLGFVEIERWLIAASAKGNAAASAHLGSIYFEGLNGEKNYNKAFAAFSKAANAGHVASMLMLADCYTKGHGVAVDFAKAEAWLKRVQAKAGSDAGSAEIATARLQVLAEAKEGANETTALRKQADAGDAAAAYKLSQLLADRENQLFYSAEDAMRYLRRAAELGEKYAQDELARQLLYENTAEAYVWRRKAAEQGVGSAQYDLGMDYAYGRGVANDPAEAARWLMLAAAQGLDVAQKSLADFNCYPGLARSEATALLAKPDGLAQLTAAAQKGSVEAQFVLGNSGRLPNRADAVGWIAKAAAQGHRAAMTALAAAYNNADGVARDLAQAHAWYARAAQLGDTEAMKRLGEDFLNGHGIAADPAAAKFWLERAMSLVSSRLPVHAWLQGTAAKITATALTAEAATRQLQSLAALAVVPSAKPAAPAAVATSAPAPTSSPARPASVSSEAEALYQRGLADLESRRQWSDKLKGVVPVDPQRDANYFQWIMAAARAGHPDAQFLAATHWLSTESAAAKKSWLEKAAAQGHAAAKQRLGTDAQATVAAAKEAAEAAKQTASDRELAANGDPDAAYRLLRARIKEIATTISADFVAQQDGQPTSGKNYINGYFDPEMSRWAEVISSRLHVSGLLLLHDWSRDSRPDLAYLALLTREQIAKLDARLQLSDAGAGTNSRAGFEKALGYLRGKLTAAQLTQAAKLVAENYSGPRFDNTIGVNCELGVAGFPKDAALAFAHYRRAAEAGFAEGQSNLGRCYQLGLGVAKDDDQARAWYVKAAGQGSAYAQQRLKDLDTYGPMARIKTLSAEERAKLSEDEWIKAETYTLNAEQRERLFSQDPAMALQFGLNYRDGANGFVQDFGRAFVWFTEAAEKGSPSALTELGTLHFKGRGRPVDKKVAFTYYLRAAERGDAVGQLNAGFCYLQGEGVDPDPLAAYDWLVKSAAQGQANAQTLVANLKQDAGLQLLLAQRGEAQALDQAKQGAANAVASAPAWDPIKDNPILQLGALATKALQGDKEAAAALNAQQQNLKSQRDLINGPAPTAAATSQSPAALKNLHDQAYVAFLNRETERAIHLWEQAAALGHVESALRLSSLYQANERGIPRDVSKARQWLEKAAASGNEDAVAELRGFEEGMAGGRWEYELGLVAYDDGAGPKAVALFEKAAALGWTEAMLSLGRMYRGGDLVTHDEAKSRAWFQQAADAKSAEGMLNLAYCHRDGVGGTPDLALARKWFEQAAQAKDDEKTVQLAREGLVSIEGNTADSANTLGISAFVAKDYVKAMEWFKKGSALGSDLATYNVADMYANGDGVKADPSEALRWFEKSAAQGNKVAKGRARELRATLKLTSNPELDEKPQSVEDAILANIAGPTTPPAPPPPALTPAQQALRDKALSAMATSQDWLNLALALCPPPAKNPQRDGLKQAFPWFKKAAEAGLEQAQFFVALALRDGFPGTPPDEAASARWMKKLGEPTGPRPMRLQYAQALESGLLGVPRDRDRAGQLYAQLAAEKFAPAVAEWERFQRETKVNPPPAPAGETAASRLSAAVAGDADAAVRHYLATDYEISRDAATETALGKALAAGATAGNFSARTVMAWNWIANRIGDEQVPEQIAQLCAAAEAGVIEARYRYGLCLWDGVESIDAPGKRLLAIDRGAAVKWFTEAAMRGHPLAHEIVGRAYTTGSGVARNEAMGRRHLRAAAALGVLRAHGQVAQSALREVAALRARIGSEGRVPNADEQPWIDALTEEAVRFFESGVKFGDADAMVAYARILDASMDRPRALGLLQSAAKLGSAAAFRELAGAYATGDRYGVARDIVKSRDNLAQLATFGDSGAAQRMGELYLGQEGHPRDSLLAYQNLALAVDLGANAVPARDAVAKTLSASDRAKADQRLEQLRLMLMAKGVRLMEPRPAPAPKATPVAAAAPAAPTSSVSVAEQELASLRAKAKRLEGRLVVMKNRVYRAPAQILVFSLQEKITLPSQVARYTLSEKDGAYAFGTVNSSTTTMELRELIRMIELAQGACIVVRAGPCKACIHERSSWVPRGGAPAACTVCSSTGCAPELVLVKGETKPY